MPDVNKIDLNKLESLYNSVMFGADRPQIVVCDARSVQGQYVLAQRDGETDFDGWHHAYVRRDDQTFLVPLWEWAEEDCDE